MISSGHPASPMATHTYSAEDLLYVRQRSLREDMHRRLHDRLRKDLDLGDLIRIQPYASGGRTVLNNIQNTGQEREVQSIPVPRQLDGTEGEWKYRGRTDSEQAEGQPIPAPSGIVAQKDEGFQKFYKAVVSPTHVRVTAGGRIVPNTRGSVSPGPKWSTEKPASDSAGVSQPASTVELPLGYGFPLPPSGFSPMTTMFPYYGPAMMPGVLPPHSAFPLMPWHHGMAIGSGFPVLSSSGTLSQPQPSSSDLKDPERSDQRSESGSFRAVSVQGHSPDKPPLRAGMTWMMPPNPTFYPTPYQAPPGYSLQAQPQRMMPAGFEEGSLPQPAAAKDSHGSSRSAPITSGPLRVAIAQSPMSSIRPSEITKNQIGVLRNSLKYLEDQLLYNRHQVDEKALEQQVNMIKQQIQQFEKNLDNQLTFEGNHYPKSASVTARPSSVSSRRQLGSKASIVSEDSIERHPYRLVNTSESSLAQPVRGKGLGEKKTSFSAGINSTKSVSAFAPIKASERNLGTKPPHVAPRVTSATLPVSAALAPPFEPKRQGDLTTLSLSRASEPRNRTEDDKSDVCAPRHRKGGMESQSMADEPLVSSDKSLPYLIGFLPVGVNPGTARDTDYKYTRSLTEDELRARHMYWGKTPRHLQKGLPKFDGKDFYPPSPTKGRSTDRETSSSSSSRRLPVGNATLDYGLSTVNTEDHLFRSLENAAPRATRGPYGIPTQSDAIGRSSRGTDEMSASVSGLQRAESCATRVGGQSSSDDILEAQERVSSPSLPDKSSSDEAEEDRDILFKGRRGSRQVSAKSPNNDILRSMLKKGRPSGNATPGAVSSTTVQGVLPNYSGYAAASLTPAIANSTTPPPRLAFAKAFDVVDGPTAATLGDRKRENLPPAGGDNPSSLVTIQGSSFLAS